MNTAKVGLLRQEGYCDVWSSGIAVTSHQPAVRMFYCIGWFIGWFESPGEGRSLSRCLSWCMSACVDGALYQCRAAGRVPRREREEEEVV